MTTISFTKYQPYDPIKVWGTLIFNGINRAYEILNDSHQIKNVDIIHDDLLKIGNPAIVTFGETDLLDSIRILIFFENYIKSRLLLEGYEIYTINANKYPELADLQKEQKKKPVKSLLYLEKYYMKDIKTDSFYNDAITDSTLNFSTLIKNSYNSIIKIPDDIKRQIEEINMKRNELHFIGIQTTVYSTIVTTNLKKIKDFARLVHKELSNRIVLSNIGFNKKLLIP